MAEATILAIAVVRVHRREASRDLALSRSETLFALSISPDSKTKSMMLVNPECLFEGAAETPQAFAHWPQRRQTWRP